MRLTHIKDTAFLLEINPAFSELHLTLDTEEQGEVTLILDEEVAMETFSLITDGPRIEHRPPSLPLLLSWLMAGVALGVALTRIL